MEAKINFKNIRWKNFLSYGNTYTEINLDTKEITVLSGINGSGKSVMLDAFYFALTGMPLRDINKPNLLNSINKKNCIVELEFNVKNKEYRIVRGIKPNIFQIFEDGELIPEDGKKVSFYQEKLNDITGLTSEVIKNILVVNSSLKSFFKLSKYEKRKVVDDIFNLEIFNHMNERVKNKFTFISEETREQIHQLNLLESTLSHQENQIKQYEEIVKSIKSKKDSQKLKLLSKKDKLNEKIEKINIRIEKKEDKLKEIKEKNAEEKIKENRKNELTSEISLLEIKLTEIPEIEQNCNECGQPLPKDIIEKLKDKNEKQKNKIIDLIAEKTEEQKNIKFKPQKDTSDLENDIQDLKKQEHSFNTLISEIEKELSTFEEELPKEPEIDIDATKEKIKETKKTIKKNKNFAEYLKITNKILLDGDIKSFIISNYVPFINEQFNYFLELFNFDAKIKFSPELDWEIISAKYQNYGYDNFSTGERMRINLAMLFTFINLSKLINFGSMKQLYSILFLDEFLDSGMDGAGIEDCLQLLIEKNKNEMLSIFIVSHKFSAGNTEFANYQAEKSGNFSKLKRI